MNEAMTAGVHHIGLAVTCLEESAAFFIDLLGWQEVRRDPNYPAIFVTDGSNMVTLWQVTDPANANLFDKNHNVGLHHVAFKVNSLQILQSIHNKVVAAGLKVEFAPEPLRAGPAKHMICYEPSGIRVEFFWDGM